MNHPNKESCVETLPAPEWLNKLESRREQLFGLRKLGHESGAGAACIDCGDKCPGLDLHFWRKLCRNCKCRKEQHKVSADEDLSGWAQFEILGQIRSKPAYMKIKALADQPVQLEWIPPNASPDIIVDYMDQLGSNKIPVAGSDAAMKRKQQLEFQVPAHDLDASLCDNLTANEAAQLEMYVQKIRENCVGQGSVVRVGNVQHGRLVSLPTLCKTFNESPSKLENDRIANQLVSSEALTGVLMSDKIYPILTSFTPFANSVLSESYHPTQLQDKAKNFDVSEIQSLMGNGAFYDKILNHLNVKNLDVTKDPLLGAIRDFREECRLNPQFQESMNNLVSHNPQYSSPLKTGGASQFFSPLQPKIPSRFPTAMKQETPMRKVKFGGLNYELGISPVQMEKDPVFCKILSSEKLKSPLKNVILSFTPMTVDLREYSQLSPTTKDKLMEIGVDKSALQSAVVNGPFYDKLFGNLRAKDVNYADCKILKPMELLREELQKNPMFQKDVKDFVQSLPRSAEIAYHSNPFKAGALQGIRSSKSSDSGFDSKPGTPSKPSTPSGVNAFAGQFMSIPGIEDMNMYPSVQPSTTGSGSSVLDKLPQSLENLAISSSQTIQSPPVLVNCKECNQPIVSGEVAVKADRAGKEAVWHPQCFKCTMCQELLADLVYFYHGGNVYCGRDLAITLKIPRCKACDELIFTKEYTAAESSTFHIKHFCCYQCDTPLAGQQYIPDDKTNMPLCLPCYDSFYAEKCKLCSQVIGPTEQGVAWGKIHWHGECFICGGRNCGKSLIGGRFCVKNEMPFCSPACVQSVL